MTQQDDRSRSGSHAKNETPKASEPRKCPCSYLSQTKSPCEEEYLAGIGGVVDSVGIPSSTFYKNLLDHWKGLVKAKDGEIGQLTQELEGIKRENSQLQADKSAYGNLLAQLKFQNSQLKAENDRLKGTNSGSK